MNVITLQQQTDLFNKIVKDCDPIDSIEEHRRGSSFYTNWIIKVDEKFYPDVDEQYYGHWMTDTFVYDSEYGMSDRTPTTLTKVEKKEVVTRNYERVKVELSD